MRRFLGIFFILILTQACLGMLENMPDFQDGTWSNCTYTKVGSETKGPYPVQIPPGLQVPKVDPDVEVHCVPIPKVATPE